MKEIKFQLPNTKDELATALDKISLGSLYCATLMTGAVAAGLWISFAWNNRDSVLQQQARQQKEAIRDIVEAEMNTQHKNIYAEAGRVFVHAPEKDAQRLRAETLAKLAVQTQRSLQTENNIHVEPTRPFPLSACIWTFAALGLGGYTAVKRSRQPKSVPESSLT